jgi:murein DD-endopeptidase MepM/ murein hydrolase activator NlpD
LQSTKKEKSTLLTATKSTEANYQKILKDKLALKQALDQEINSFESQLKMIIDPKSFPPAGKGILAWPLDNIFITQNFGKTTDSGRLYVSGTHNGVDFRASIGTAVKSAGNGVVEGTGNTDTVCPGASYGKWVFIRYDNGLASVYGHFSVVSAKAGDRVKTGDVVGYSGNTGYSTGPHLHMGVYAGQGVKISSLKSTVCKGTYTIPVADLKAYLDPLVYL